MKIALLGPFATADIAPLLDGNLSALPRGYPGAPLMAVLARVLLERGHQIEAVTLSSDMPLDGPIVSARGGGLRLQFCPMRPRAWPFNGRRVGRIVDLYGFERGRLRQALHEAAPEIVHAHWSYEFAWAAQDGGWPLLITCHDAPVQIARLQQRWRQRAYRWLRAAMARRVLARATAVTAVSPYLASALQPWTAAPVAVVPNPLSPEVWRLRRSAEPGRQRVLVVGNGFDGRKNVQAALQAFAAVAPAWPQAELVLLGTECGPGEAAQRWWQASGHAAPVRFVGPVPHAEVLAWMTRGDVLLHPAIEESFGVVVAEAMALGLPVLAGAQSGAVPWVAGPGALLVDVQQPTAIARGLQALLSQPPSGEQLEAARLQVQQRFSAGAIAQRYEQAYGEVLQHAPLLAARSLA